MSGTLVLAKDKHWRSATRRSCSHLNRTIWVLEPGSGWSGTPPTTVEWNQRWLPRSNWSSRVSHVGMRIVATWISLCRPLDQNWNWRPCRNLDKEIRIVEWYNIKSNSLCQSKEEKRSLSPSETGLPGIAVPPGATVASRLLAFGYGLISDRMVELELYISCEREIEPMHLSVEGLRSCDWLFSVSQELERPIPTDFCVTGTVVKHQPPPMPR